MNTEQQGGMRHTLLIGLCTLLTFPLVARASEQDDARKLSNAGTIVPLERITAQVRRQLQIEDILEVELEDGDHGYYYEVEVVDVAGNVRKLRYDAATGTPLGEAEGDD